MDGMAGRYGCIHLPCSWICHRNMLVFNQRENKRADTLSTTEWELRPSSPSSIRLIHFGKLLDDKYSLEGTAT